MGADSRPAPKNSWLQDAWDWMVDTARGADASLWGGDSWVPPVEEELVLTARASELGQLFPFTSHNSLRFTDGPPFWAPHGRDDVTELPGSISFDNGGPHASPLFRVWSGRLLQTPDPVLVLTTPDAAKAVQALIRLFATAG